MDITEKKNPTQIQKDNTYIDNHTFVILYAIGFLNDLQSLGQVKLKPMGKNIWNNEKQ